MSTANNRLNTQTCVLCGKNQISARHYSQSHGFHLISYVTVIASTVTKHGGPSYRCKTCRRGGLYGTKQEVADRTFSSAGDAVDHVLRFHEADVRQDPRVDQDDLWNGWAVAAAESRQARDAAGAVSPPAPALPGPSDQLPTLTWELFDRWALKYLALQEERTQLLAEITSLKGRVEDLTRLAEEQRVKLSMNAASAVSNEFFKVYEDIRSR